jgi:ArsR family transcriptional regulator, arsenate/arsenite/antimonite-responsive transcriptional repressor
MNADIPITTCCPPDAAFDPKPLEGPEADDELAALSKALAHPVRVRILRTLSCGDSRVCRDIAGELPLAQSTVSEHLRILKEAGLIRSREAGTRALYCVVPDALDRLKALVSDL